ncbi:MAG: hypothetical protein JW904_04715 [Spirochaetales bacterium]|nr:hypothetical protein [Spirochaetales bacterium]
MKVQCILSIALLLEAFSCTVSDNLPHVGPDPVSDSGIVFTISYTKGDAAMSTYTVSYAAWAADATENMVQHLFVTQRVHDYSLASNSTPLSYWEENYRGQTVTGEVDAVTGATQKNTDFTITAEYLYPTVRTFRLYFEIDHSFDGNDWFAGEQPGIIYYADIDLDSVTTKYILQPLGWAHAYSLSAPFSIAPGTMYDDMRYVTYTKSGSDFGTPYTDNTPATHMVNTLTVTVTQS